MSRFQSRVGWAVAALAIVVMTCQVVEAQREGGRRGRGGFRGGVIPAVQLVTGSEKVQAAINLTDEQKDKVKEINDQLREDRRAAFQERGRDFRAAIGKIETLNQESSGKLAEVLDENQQKRLAGISIQVNGPAALREPLVAEQLKITDEQNSKLDDVREKHMRAMMEAPEQDLSREERRANQEKRQAELLAVLTSEQKAQYESLQGEKVEIDMSDFRGGGFRGRDGGGRRDGQGRGRNRPDRDADGADTGSSDSN